MTSKTNQREPVLRSFLPHRFVFRFDKYLGRIKVIGDVCKLLFECNATVSCPFEDRDAIN